MVVVAEVAVLSAAVGGSAAGCLGWRRHGCPARGGVSTGRGDAAAPAAAAAEEAHAACCPLLSSPWHDALAFFLTPGELWRVICGCVALRLELTVGAEGVGARRLLVAPVVELRIETAEAELDRLSLPHIHVMRVWNRLSFNAAAAAAGRGGPGALRGLQKFICKGCPLYPSDVSDLLAPTLASTKALQLLNLEKNQLGDPAVQQLCTSGVIARVETLNLRFNKIGDDGAKALASCDGARALRWLNLKMNCVRDDGALALASLLRCGGSMTLLNLRRQMPGLTDRTALGFAEALRANNSLEQLRFRRNKITDRGATALAEAVVQRFRVNPTGRLELDLEENKVGDHGALALLRAAAVSPVNTRLELLLHGNPSTRDSLCRVVAESGEVLDANDPRVIFSMKPEAEL